jgi:GntR family transcriptional repressor for pyruvate dehydrogenase complex
MPRRAPADSAQTLAAIGPIARSSVVDAVADRLRGEILAGRLAAGERLPSERELSMALGVNRLTLRASLARLEALGLISTRHGAGTIVASWRERAGLDTLATLVGSLTPADPTWYELVTSTLEIRRILASEAIALAAARHTPADLVGITACQQVLRDHVQDPIAYARADLAFMRSVVRAARNVGLELLLNTFVRFPDENPRLIAALYDRCEQSVAIYDLVIGIIAAGDADAARLMVRRALEEMDAQWMLRWAPKSPAGEVGAAVKATAVGSKKRPLRQRSAPPKSNPKSKAPRTSSRAAKESRR